MGSHWRLGRKVPRNIYLDDRMVAVAVGEDSEARMIAQRIVDAMNDAGRVPEVD